MTNRLTRITTLLGSLLLSATALAAPKRFDTEIAVPPADEDAVMHYISKCSPFTTPGLRICEQMPLDLNKDGNTDLLVGANQNGPKRFYAGRGEGLFNPAVYFGFEQPTSSLTVADLDGDLDLDMVETVRSNGTVGVNVIYVNHNNTLTSLFNDEQQLDGTHYRSSSAAVGDVNNDGRLDIVVANETPGAQSNPAGAALPYTHTNYVYLNQSTPNNIVFGAAIPIDPAGTEGYTRRILLLDIEGDGDLDLVGTKASNHLDPSGQGNVLYVNHTANGGAGPNPFDAPIELSPTNPADNTDVANSIAAGDLDGDGDPDLVFGTWSRMNGAVPAVPEAAPDRYYVNNSMPAGPNFNTTGTFGPPANSTNVRLGNFDNDNDLDALVVTWQGQDRLHLNRNDSVPGSFFDPVGFALVEPAGHDQSRGLDTADLNKDGSLDVVIVHRDQPGLRFLNNDLCSGPGNTCNPFENDGPGIPPQDPPTGDAEPQDLPIDIDDHLYRLTVEDNDNVYPADFTAKLPAPGASASYRCAIGVGTSGIERDMCVGAQIIARTPGFVGLLGPIEVKVHDGVDLSNSFDLFYVTVGAGHAPAFTSTPVTTATEGTAYSYAVTASDVDGDNVAISVDTTPGSPPLPAWLTLTPNGSGQATLAGTPQLQAHVGSHPVKLRATGGALSETQSFTIVVANVNDAPIITTTSLPNATQGTMYSTTVTATDEDVPADTLAYTASGLPAGLSISGTGVVGGTPTASGSFTVAVTVTDGKGGTANANLPLEVSAPGNQPPTFTPPAAQTATVGQEFTLNLTASDPDSDPLTFSATGLPAGLSISPAGAISGTPTTAGPATVNVTVNDGRGGTATGSFDITVQAGGGPPNQNPTVAAPGPQTATVGTAFSLTVTGSDPDSDPLTFSATGLPAGLTMSATGAISGTPTTNVGSPFTVGVSVSDGKGGSGSASFQLTVNPAPVNNPPPAPAPSGGSGGGGSFGLGELLAMLVLAGAAGLRRRRWGAIRSGAL